MLPEAKVIHRTPARFRVKIPTLKGDQAFFAQVQERLAQCAHVSAVRVNPLTGSVLISHSGDLRTIARYAEKHHLFRLAPEIKLAGNLTHATLATYKTLDAQIKRLSGGGLDLPHTAFLTFIGAGIYQLSRGRFVAPAWHTAFWYAFNVFLKAQDKKA